MEREGGGGGRREEGGEWFVDAAVDSGGYTEGALHRVAAV
jgi:hypothetical protein